MVDLSQPAIYIHWGVLLISLSNLIVLVLMVVVFILAVLLPFPGGTGSRGEPQ